MLQKERERGADKLRIGTELPHLSSSTGKSKIHAPRCSVAVAVETGRAMAMEMERRNGKRGGVRAALQCWPSRLI